MIIAYRLVLLCTLLVFVTACTVRRVEVNSPVYDFELSFVRPGETTLHQIAKAIGAPDEIAALEHAYMAEYKWSKTRSSSLDMAFALRFLTPFAPSLTFSGTGVDIHRLIIVYDQQFVVRSYAFTRPEQSSVLEFWPF